MSRDWLRQPIGKAGQIDQMVAQHIESRKESGSNKDPERKDSTKETPREPTEPVKTEPAPLQRSETAPPAVIAHFQQVHFAGPIRHTATSSHELLTRPAGRVTPPLLSPIGEERPPVPPPRDKVSPRPPDHPAVSQPLPVLPTDKVHDHRRTEFAIAPASPHVSPHGAPNPISPRGTSPRDSLGAAMMRKQSSGKSLVSSDKRAVSAGRKMLMRTISYDVQTDEDKITRLSTRLYRSKSLPCIHTNADPWGLRPVTHSRLSRAVSRRDSDNPKPRMPSSGSQMRLEPEADIGPPPSPEYVGMVGSAVQPVVSPEKASEFIYMLVATHPLFVSSAQFLKILRGLFCITGLPAEDLRRVQGSVYMALKSFVALEYWDLTNRAITGEMKSIMAFMKNSSKSSWAAELEALQGRPKPKEDNSRPTADSKFRNAVDDVEPQVLATQLTLLHFKLWHNVRIVEWVRSITGHPESAENLHVLLEAGQSLTYWTATQIVGCPSLKQRVLRLTQLLSLAKALHELKNIDCFKALMTGLNLSSVKRLKNTWKGLSSKATKLFASLEYYATDEAMKALVSFENMNTAAGPMIPPVKALVSVLAAFAQSPFASVRDRMGRLAGFLQGISTLRNTPYLYPAILAVQACIRSSGRLHEKELGQHSLFCEPDSGYKKEIEKVTSILQRVTSKGAVKDDLQFLVDTLPRLSPQELNTLSRRARSPSGGIGRIFREKPMTLQFSQFTIEFSRQKVLTYSAVKDHIKIGNPNKVDLHIKLSLLPVGPLDKCRVTFIPSATTIQRGHGVAIEVEAIVIATEVVELLVLVDIQGSLPYILPFRVEGKALMTTGQEIKWDAISGGKLIGQGAAGAVYRVEWEGRTVAVKRFFATELDPNDLKEFVTEITLLSKLSCWRHPCLVNFIGACTTFPNLALVMEFVAKGSLASVLRKKEVDLPWPLRVKFALDGCRGMWFLHDTLNILHRDLKSDNLLVDSLDPDADGCLKVTDFSISREAPRELVKMTLNTGTSQWRAPEVFKGQVPSRAADVYSYGIIMWELIMRDIPFSEVKWQHEIENLVISGQRPKIPDNLWVPPEYRTLMEAMWQAEPARRPSFKDAIEALRLCQMQQRFAGYTFDGVNLKEDAPDVEDDDVVP